MAGCAITHANVQRIPVIFPPETAASAIEAWAQSLGLRLKSDLHGNMVAVSALRHH